jgi:putative CocE/NonD family hydrolase
MKRVNFVFLVLTPIVIAGCVRVVNILFDLDPLEYRVEVEEDVMVPLSDGVELATDIYRPVGLEQSPVILIRTPYNKHPEDLLGQLGTIVPKLLARHGYTALVQDVRGRYKSDGDFYPFLAEPADGHEVLAWAAKQPWSTGKVGSWGGSYSGYTQWAMADNSPELDAMVTLVTSAEISKVYYEGGAVNFANILFWATTNRGREWERVPTEILEQGIYHLPLIEADNIVTNDNVIFYDDAVTYNSINVPSPISYKNLYSEVSAPVLSIAGWYDQFVKYQIEDIIRIREKAEDPARSMSRIVIGPWGHGLFENPPVKFKDAGIIKMGQLDRVLDFYDAMLKGEDTGVDDWPVFYIYVMGENVWRGFDEWPPPSMKPTPFYFHSNGNANTREGGGGLSRQPPGDEPSDTFTYDPSDPVPTTGGPLIGSGLGPKKQEAVEQRQDVLVYTSEPLTEPLTTMGPVSVTLFAATDARDADFTARLCDVYPDGMSINITDGIIRARFRSGDMKNPELIQPGRVYEYTIDLWHTAYVFAPGHRIRVQVSSSNFPRFDRNLNTGEDISTSTKMISAQQTIHHDTNSSSLITLPLMP